MMPRHTLALGILIVLWPCACPGAEASPGWTFVFVIAADTPAPTETRQALDAVARTVARVARQTPAHRFVVLHEPSDGSSAYALLTRGPKETRRDLRDGVAAVDALRAAADGGAGCRRAFLFVGHSLPMHAGAPTGSVLRLDRLGSLLDAAGAGAPAFELVVLHCCHSARIETVLGLLGRTRTVVACSGRVQPQALDYGVLTNAASRDTGASLARRLAAAAGPMRRALVVVETDAERLRGFSTHLDAFAESLLLAMQTGRLHASEFGDLYEPSASGMPDRVDLLPLLCYASQAHWLPAKSRQHARRAADALRPQLSLAADRLTLHFPWRGRLAARHDKAGLASPWPRLVLAARERSQLPAPPFLGWPLERELLQRARPSARGTGPDG